MSDQNSNPSRVAIKFGKPSSSKKHSRPANPRRHRAHALEDGDSASSGCDDDRDSRHHGRHEMITELDWSTSKQGDDRDRKRKSHHNSGFNGHERHDREDNEDGIKKEEEETKAPVKFGLTINMRNGASSSRDQRSPRRRSRSRSSSRSRDLEKKPKSLDDQAMDALLGYDNPPKKRKTSANADRSPEPEDYRTVPIDDFGATLLKGLGWDGKMRGKVKEATPRRHANLAGLGMKDAKGAEELSSWNQKVNGGGKKDSRPRRLEDHAREERKNRQRIEEKYGDSYKKEREREHERERHR